MEIFAVEPKWRVTIGGNYEDFDDRIDELNYLAKKLDVFTYGSINKVYTFKRIEDEKIN